MTRPASRIAIAFAIFCALGGAVLIVARAPRKAAGPTPGAAFGH